MIFRNDLERVRTRLDERRMYLKREVKGLPKGSLFIINRGGKYYYYERFPKGGNRKKEHRIGISNDPERIFALVRKRYVQKAIIAIDSNLQKLDILLREYSVTDEESVMKEFVEKYPQLADGLYYNHQSRAEWEKGFKPQAGFYEKDLKSTSLKGVPMRSEGEIYISSRLDHYNIPHRFEASLNSPLIGRVPDFTILRPRDRKIFYWEHFGKVDDPKYVSANIEKVIEYIDYGITPWDNLIMTYNYSGGGFNAKLIDSMIEGWLL